jgi:nicotinamidase/pyrazinamidase
MKTVFFDVDTQLDFLYPAGALYVPGAEKIVETLGQLTQFAAGNQIQIVSTMDAHAEDDAEFKTWKPHCVAGTTGQQKAAATLVNRRMVLSDARAAKDAPQILVEKQSFDCFTNPNLTPLVALLNADRFVVYGVATEVCVQFATFGLLKTGARVELVTDAIKGLSAAAERETIERFQAQGGLAVKSSDVLACGQQD